jgi:hypothetical protein
MQQILRCYYAQYIIWWLVVHNNIIQYTLITQQT